MDDICVILASFALGVFTVFTGQFIENDYKPAYKTNLAKYEIELNKCLGYPKGNIRDCHEVAIYKSKTCVTGCE